MIGLTVSVLGLGYIGLPLALLLASNGAQVNGCDTNATRVNQLNNGESPIQEDGFQTRLEKCISEKKFHAYIEPKPADIHVICVPTPIKISSKKTPEPDLTMVFEALESIAGQIKKNDIIILESTVPVGTTEKLVKILKKQRPDLNFDRNNKNDISVAFCPERIIPGDTFNELINNDRIIGGYTESCGIAIKHFYEAFIEGKIVITSCHTAELVKLAENSFRDTQIAFANELSIICDEADIDVWELIRLANLHPRVDILKPGPGVGGHCIAVDPWFLISQFEGKTPLIGMARQVNDMKIHWTINKINEHVKSLMPKTIICYGVTYKPNTNDLRESPALEIFNQLRSKYGDKVIAVDPYIEDGIVDGLFNVIPDEIENVKDVYSVVLVAHDQFKNIQWDLLKLYDSCGILEH